MKKSWCLSLFFVCCMPFFVWGQTANSSLPVSGQAELFMQLQQMQNQITQLQGALEDQQLLIKQLQQESLERYQDLDKRISATVNSSQATVTPPASDTAAVVSTPKDSVADPAKEKLYYEASFSLIAKKDYAKAAQAFTAFLNKFPKSQYAGNAQYWLAEVNLAQGDTKGAADNFSKVISLYPNHPKIPDAMYKLGTVQARLGNQSKAKELFSQLVAKYPKSSAAVLAKQALQSLK